MVLALFTPRSFVMFETPFTSLLSKNTLLLYPSLAPGYVPEFYINPYKGEGFLLFSSTIKRITAGGMLYSTDTSFIPLVGIRRGENNVGFAISYSRINEAINGASFSFSHRSAEFGYDLGVLYDKEAAGLYSAYVRSYITFGDMTDAVFGIRGLYDENPALSGFFSLLLSPVSGQYMELVLGYSPFLKNLYFAAGISHQFYKNFSLSMGFFYPILHTDAFPAVSLSRFELPATLPYRPDFRCSVELMDDSGIYTFGIGMDYSLFKTLVQTGRVVATPASLVTGISVYFYTF